MTEFDFSFKTGKMFKATKLGNEKRMGRRRPLTIGLVSPSDTILIARLSGLNILARLIVP